MGEEGVLDVDVNIWPVVGSVLAGDIDKRKSGGESGAEFGYGDLAALDRFKVDSKAMGTDNSNQCANNSEAASDNGKFVGGNIHFNGSRLEFWTALFVGFFIACPIVSGHTWLPFWFYHRLPFSAYWS